MVRTGGGLRSRAAASGRSKRSFPKVSVACPAALQRGEGAAAAAHGRGHPAWAGPVSSRLAARPGELREIVSEHRVRLAREPLSHRPVVDPLPEVRQWTSGCAATTVSPSLTSAA